MSSSYVEYEYSSDDLDHTQDYIYLPIIKVLGDRKNLKMLDLGCGNGSMANKLIDLGYDVYGVDASLSGIEIAKQKNPNRFFCYDLSSGKIPLELEQIKFDLIISTEVIEHLYSPHSFVKLCGEILINGNAKEIVFTTPYHGYFKNLILSVFNKWDSHLAPLWEGGHIKFWSRNTITQLFQSANFKVIRFIGCGRIPYVWKSMLIHAKINE